MSFAQCLIDDASKLIPVEADADEPALLMYTSDSTGMPKGMLHAHRITHAYRPSLTKVYKLELSWSRSCGSRQARSRAHS